MSKAKELLANPEFNALPVEVQNRLLMEALTNTVSVAPATVPAPVSACMDQAIVTHINGQPFLLAPMTSDPNAGISGPIPAQPKFTNVDAAKSTIGAVGDTVKTGLGLALGTVGLLGNLAVDILTLGQSKGDVMRQAQSPAGVTK